MRGALCGLLTGLLQHATGRDRGVSAKPDFEPVLHLWQEACWGFSRDEAGEQWKGRDGSGETHG